MSMCLGSPWVEAAWGLSDIAEGDVGLGTNV